MLPLWMNFKYVHFSNEFKHVYFYDHLMNKFVRNNAVNISEGALYMYTSTKQMGRYM